MSSMSSMSVLLIVCLVTLAPLVSSSISNPVSITYYRDTTCQSNLFYVGTAASGVCVPGVISGLPYEIDSCSGSTLITQGYSDSACTKTIGSPLHLITSGCVSSAGLNLGTQYSCGAVSLSTSAITASSTVYSDGNCQTPISTTTAITGSCFKTQTTNPSVFAATRSCDNNNFNQTQFGDVTCQTMVGTTITSATGQCQAAGAGSSMLQCSTTSSSTTTAPSAPTTTNPANPTTGSHKSGAASGGVANWVATAITSVALSVTLALRN